MHERNYGLDLLKAISMLMVVFLHTLGHGGILNSCIPLSVNYEIAWGLEIACFGAINCYALISGYAGIGARFKVSNIVKLWIRVFFVSCSISILFAVVKPATLNIYVILKTIFPVMFKRYWYFTAYFGMFFFIPILNYIVNHMEEKLVKYFLFCLFVVFSVLQTMFHSDAFLTNNGYSTIWLSICYILGGYIRKYQDRFNVSIRKSIGIWLLCIFVTFMSKLGIEVLTTLVIGEARGGTLLVGYLSPTIIIGSIALLNAFSKLSLYSRLKKIIVFLSNTSFGVYLVHDNDLIRENIIAGKFGIYAESMPFKFLIEFLITGLSIYFVSLLIESVRALLFKLLKVDNIGTIADRFFDRFNLNFD